MLGLFFVVFGFFALIFKKSIDIMIQNTFNSDIPKYFLRSSHLVINSMASSFILKVSVYECVVIV